MNGTCVHVRQKRGSRSIDREKGSRTRNASGTISQRERKEAGIATFSELLVDFLLLSLNSHPLQR